MTTRILEPELTAGLTVYGDGWGAQIRHQAVTEDESSSPLGFVVTGSTQVLVLSLHNVERSTEDGHPYVLDNTAARELRDLLNIATARGML